MPIVVEGDFDFRLCIESALNLLSLRHFHQIIGNMHHLCIVLVVLSVIYCLVDSWSSPSKISWRKTLSSIVISSSLVISSIAVPAPTIADNRLNAPSAAGTRVNSDAESLLRYGLPLRGPGTKEVREIQEKIEAIKSDLKGRRVPFAASDVTSSRRLLNTYEEVIIKAAPSSRKTSVQASINRLRNDFDPLEKSLGEETKTGSGSIQEREFLDQSFAFQRELSKELTTLEELLVPENFKRAIPAEYSNLPALQGRAEVDFVIKKSDGSAYAFEGKLYDQVDLKMVIDGYNAPLTGGNFVDLVNKGFYVNKKVSLNHSFPNSSIIEESV